jgi:lipopolysaccharide export system protein LptC
MSLAPEETRTVTVADERVPRFPLRRSRHNGRKIHIERYSRFVTRMKLLMPAMALGLLLLVAVWPRIQSTLQRVAVPLPHIDTSAARDVKMVNMHYAGFDRHNRPYTITADVARQRPGKDDMVELEGPKSDMTADSGTWIAIDAYTGLYQPQRQMLDMFGNVEIFQDKGNEFHADSMHVDIAKGTAESSDAVEAQGPFGVVEAQGFRMEDHGKVIYFIGKSHLTLNADQIRTAP